MAKTLRLPYSRLQLLELSISRPIKCEALTVPKIKISEIITGPIGVSLVDLEQVSGNTSSLEQLVLLSIAKQRNCKRVFEIGTFDGKTTANLAANLNGAEIFTIDLPAERVRSAGLPISRHDMTFIMKDQIGEKFSRSQRIVQLHGDTAKFDFSPWYGSCDFVFVDACHEYEYVLNDSEVALKLLAPNGAILWHDYSTWIGVTRALNDLHRRDLRFRHLRFIAGTTLCLLI
jgi:predicted O-methyltransferase YrrM